MTNLYLHIGHGKTGSSWLQSCLRLSRRRLATLGLSYPKEGDEPDDDYDTRISSGNGRSLLQSGLKDYRSGSTDLIYSSHSLVFSSEYLFGDLCSADGICRLEKLRSQGRFKSISILLFVRDPLGFAISAWQQRIKREGSIKPLSDCFSDFDNVYSKVANLLESLVCIPEVEISVRNYSRCRHRLSAELASWLGVNEQDLIVPRQQRVNRSLTQAELEFQRELNRVLGPCGRLLSDPLCERLPSVVPDEPRPPIETQLEFYARILPDISRANVLIPREHQYQCDAAPPSASGDMSLSREQIEVIAGTLGEEIKSLRELVANLRSRPELHSSVPTLARAILRKAHGKFSRIAGDAS